MPEATVLIARCPVHGLHGEREECFVCGGPVEQVPMVFGSARLPEMHNPDHDAPFAAMVQAMADELRANRHKGDRAGWLTMSGREAVSEVLYHAAKLAYALRQFERGEGEGRQVLEFAADVANCSMMVADVAGVLVEGERPCLCGASPPDGFGNREHLGHRDCPIHGAARA
jgi:hypothetical protein